MLVSQIVVGNARNPAAAMDGANTELINSGPQGVAARSESKGSFSIIVCFCERPREVSRVKVVNLRIRNTKEHVSNLISCFISFEVDAFALRGQVRSLARVA